MFKDSTNSSLAPASRIFLGSHLFLFLIRRIARFAFGPNSPKVATASERKSRSGFLVAAAIVCFPLGYAVVLLLPHVSSPSGGFGRGIAGIGMLAWMGLAMAWIRLVYMPKLMRSRERWNATHVGRPG